VRDILSRITKWWEAGETFGLATVVGTYRSAPRDPGAALAVSSSADHEVVGSVSGGCVEGAVYELSLDVCQTSEPVLETYGVSDDDAFAVGLTCGGIIDIFVERVDRSSFPELGEIAAAVERGEPVAVATVISGPGRVGARRVIWAGATAPADGWHSGASGTLGSARLDAAVDDDVRGMLAQGLTGIRRYGEHGERRGDDLSVFVNSFAPAPRMLVFGAIDFAAAVARVGKFLGYHVTVCDARKVFATPSRFPDADEVVVDWPHRFLAGTEVDARTVICVLTHDPKFDVPLLEVALRTPAGYIGAMGSRRTHDDRLARLREAGLTEGELARLRSPIGLDLGARTPEETAVSIAAELIQLRWGGTGHPLTTTEGRIHHELAGSAVSGGTTPRTPRLDLGLAADAAAHGVPAPGRRGTRLGAPFGDPGEPGADELEAFQEPQHLGQRPDMQLGRRLAVHSFGLAALARGVLLQGAVADGQVATRRQAVPVLRDDLVRVRVVADEVQRAGAQHGRRPAQVEPPGDIRVLQDAGRVAEVPEYHADLVTGGEQGPAVRGDHGIDVDVDHAGLRRYPLGQLVHVGLGGQAAAEVEELPDSGLGSQVAHHPAEK
jgi:xanthine dehydrogenase accessory factor